MDSTQRRPPLKIRFGTGFSPCNYDCDYCVTNHPEEDQVQPLPFSDLITRIGRNVVQPRKAVSKALRLFYSNASLPTEWDKVKYFRVVERLAELPFSINVRIGVVGETFLSRPLVDGARRLTHAENVEAVNLISNLSFSIAEYEKILEGFQLNRLAMVCSFHPTEVPDRHRWIETARWMNEQVDLAVVLVAWPPLLDELPNNYRQLTEVGCEVFIQSFNGWYEGRKYPEAYTAEQRQVLRSYFYSHHDYEHMVNLKQPGSCYAGVDYVYMDINGEVWRCGTYQSRLGNIFDTFYLNQKPLPCPGKQCWCDTENLNTVQFREHYQLRGLNQHKYSYCRDGDEWGGDY